MHPDFYRGPGDGEAAGRLHRRPAARAAARRRRATGRGSPTSPGSACSGRRTSPAGTTTRWLDTSTFRGRWIAANEIAGYDAIDDEAAYDADRERRRRRCARRCASGATRSSAPTTRKALERYADAVAAAATADWQQETFRLLRQNALRMLIATSPEMQTC